jgi:branched-subunit amino acid transport protein
MVAILVAWRYRVTFGTIVAGLAALHLFDWMF